MTNTSSAIDAAARLEVVNRATWQAAIDELRVREKAHTHEGDAISASCRRLPMVEIDGPDAARRAEWTIRHAARGLRGPQAAHRLLLDVAYRRVRWTSARGARTSRPRSARCRTCTPATPPSPCSARAHGRKPAAIANFMGWELPWYSVVRVARPPPRRAHMA